MNQIRLFAALVAMLALGGCPPLLRVQVHNNTGADLVVRYKDGREETWRAERALVLRETGDLDRVIWLESEDGRRSPALDVVAADGECRRYRLVQDVWARPDYWKNGVARLAYLRLEADGQLYALMGPRRVGSVRTEPVEPQPEGFPVAATDCL